MGHALCRSLPLSLCLSPPPAFRPGFLVHLLQELPWAGRSPDLGIHKAAPHTREPGFGLACAAVSARWSLSCKRLLWPCGAAELLCGTSSALWSGLGLCISASSRSLRTEAAFEFKGHAQRAPHDASATATKDSHFRCPCDARDTSVQL